jgi:hypothetical protein
MTIDGDDDKRGWRIWERLQAEAPAKEGAGKQSHRQTRALANASLYFSVIPAKAGTPAVGVGREGRRF